ncbi:MAG: glycosyltransferase [Candidatus Lokiarchaeota archaeon]|nr:glycosyltransferase [Candidatus Lokiarchaeota archaeon]
MKIAFLVDSLLGGGKERQLLYLAQELSLKNQILVISFNDDIFYKDILDLPVNIITFSKNKRYSIKTYLFLYKKLYYFKPEIIHIWDKISHLIALPYILTHKTKIVNGSIRFGGKLDKNIVQKWVSRISYTFSDKIVANSFAGLKVENLYQSNKSIVIFNGIDCNDKNIKTEFINCFYNEYKRFDKYIVMVARFYPSKDYITFIKSAKIVLQKYKNVGFYCIGEGPNRNEAEIESDIYLNKNIFFLGQCFDVKCLLNNFDIGVLLNNTIGHAEGLSNAIMEYMLAGLPVVATNAGGNPEIINDGATGFLVSPFDDKIVADKIIYLLQNQEEAKKMGCEGRNVIKKRFSKKIMSRRYLTLYNDLIG